MTISFEPLRTRKSTIIPLITSFMLGLMTLINPYSREHIILPNIGGIFIRSLFIISILWTIWTYRYGFNKAFGLLIIYYGVHELIFAIGIFGILAFAYLNLFWYVRLITGMIGLMIIAIGKFYHINRYSIITGILFFVYFYWLYQTWPIEYFDGEGNIPLTLIPQIEETLYNIFFPLWFYFLVRLKNAN